MSRRRLQRRTLAAALVVAVAAWLAGGAAKADGREGLGQLPENDPNNADTLPKELEGIGIDANLGVELPKDLQLVDQDGNVVRSGDYFDGSKPTILVMAYYACPMLCTLVLNGTLEAMGKLPFRLGQEYRVLTVSFDPRDTPKIAAEKRANYLKEYGKTAAPKDWDFLTGNEAQVKRLADAIGFHYRWDAAQNQYAHAAGMFVVTPDGRLSRMLSGVRFDPQDVRLALAEATGGKIGSLTERILLFCFHYEPKVGKYVVAAKQVMKLGGVLTVLVLGLTVALFLRGEKKKSFAANPVQQPVHEA